LRHLILSDFHLVRQSLFVLAFQLELRMIRADPKDRDFKKHFAESHGVFVKYQMAVHG
jgi:hypothetical protein